MTQPSTYLVKEIFGPTLQGEGAHAGCACVFLRFAVCNLACTWCDTDFAKEGARRMTAEDIVTELTHRDTGRARRVIVSGGEPALQWDDGIAGALGKAGFVVHMESNGTRQLKAAVDWLTISPKPQFHVSSIVLAKVAADECKVVVDDTVDVSTLVSFEKRYVCEHYWVQPCDDGDDTDRERSLARCIEFVHGRPRWRLSLQQHKITGLP